MRTAREEGKLKKGDMVLLAAVAAAWNAYHRRFVYTILLLMWAHAGLFSTRHVPIFGIVAAPIIAAFLTELGAPLGNMKVAEWLPRVGRGLAGFNAEIGAVERIGRVPVVFALSVLALAGLFWARAGDKFQASFDPKRFPVQAAGGLSPSQCAFGTFSTDQWSDYLIYRHYPNMKTFFDGRSDFYGEKFGDRYLEVVDSKWNWEKPLDEYGVRTVILPAEASVASVLKGSSHWRVVYDDHMAIVFERVAGGQQSAGPLPQAITNPAVTDGGLRLTIGEMIPLDWSLLSDALTEDAGDELQRALKYLCFGQGWLRKNGSPSGDTTRYVRRIWKGLAGGPYQAGDFRVERDGRWGVQFAIDARYAAERAPRRRPRQDQTPWECGWQAANAGSRSDLSPFRSGSADARRWYQGFVIGLARRAKTARASRAARVFSGK